MSKQSVKRVQLGFRVLGIAGWIVFLMSALFFMGDLAPRATMALASGGGLLVFAVGMLFGGVLRKWF